MTGDDYGRLAYLALLLVAVAGWMISANRGRIGKMAQQAAVWGFIFLGTVAAIGLWSDIGTTSRRAPPCWTTADESRCRAVSTGTTT